MSPDSQRSLPIGETLKEARQRLGLEIREAEERTKIRLRYLRALENEDWEVLPAAAYVRAFLRTYGQVLGLDGERLADEYRRRHEEPEGGFPRSEPLLSERRRPGDRGPSRGPLLGGIAALLVALLVVLGLVAGGEGDDDGGDRPGDRQARQQERAEGGGGQRGGQPQRQGRQRAQRGQRQRQGRQPLPLRLVALTDVRVCVVAGGDRALIDNQVLSAGTPERFGRERRWRVDVQGGEVRLRVGDRSPERIETTDPITYEADSRGIRPAARYLGPDCP